MGEDCPAARHRLPQRWQGYCPAALWVVTPADEHAPGKWSRIAMPIGVECAHDLRPFLGHYPGPVLVLKRSEKKKAWTWEIRVQKKWHVKPPATFDVRLTIYRLWGVRPPEAELPGSAEPGQLGPDEEK